MISGHFGAAVKDGQYFRTRDLQLSIEYFLIALSSHDVRTATAAVRTEQLDALMFPVNPAFDTLSLASLDGPQWHDQRP